MYMTEGTASKVTEIHGVTDEGAFEPEVEKINLGQLVCRVL